MDFYLIPLSAPECEPVTVAQARRNSSIDDSEFDLELEQSIREAREYLEERTEATLMQRRWRLTLNAFPGCSAFRLPRWPATSIEQITYIDSNGDLQTWDPSNYRLIQNYMSRSELTLAANKTWPSTQSARGVIQIDFTAGFGDKPSDVPARFMRVMLLLTSHWFENREAAADGSQSEIFYGVEPIVNSLKDPEDELEV